MLFVVSSLAAGGSEKKTVMITNQLADRGYSVSLVYLNSPEYFRDLVSRKVKLYKLDRKSAFDIGVARLRKFIIENNITDVIAMNMYPMLYTYIAAKTCRRDITVMASINTTRFRTRREAAQMLLYAPVMLMIDRVIFGCHYQMELWIRKYFIPRNRSVVIYNGVDTTHYSIKSAFNKIAQAHEVCNLQGNSLVIGTVARLMDEKGHKYIFHCIKNLVDEGINVKHIVVGDGPKRVEYEALVDHLGIRDRISFVGSQTDVRGYIGLMDIFILASVAVETFSNALLEAMSMGKAVISTNISGANEMIDDGQTGILVKPADAGDLASSIKSLSDEKRRNKLGTNARQVIVKRFSLDRMISNYCNLISANAK